MFEKEIKSISDFSLTKIKKLGAYFTVEQLNSTDLHPAITRYIDSELEYLIFLDRKELVQKSAFDYSNPEVVKYFNLITSEIKSNKKISFEDAKNLIVQAVSFTANFLVRPKWSLAKFIYNEDQLKSIDEIRLSLNYLYYYDYLKNVLKTYIKKKRPLNFSLIDFEVALNKIDKQLFASHSHKLIDNALFSIADFFSMSGIDANKISPNCVELFLKEKDLIDQLFRLRRSLPVNARRYYEINEIINIIHTPTSLDKSELLPSKTDIDEERKLETPIEVNTDEPKPEIKNEKKEEVVQEEMFEFDGSEEATDNNTEVAPKLEDKIPEQQDKTSEEQADVPEEKPEAQEIQDQFTEPQNETYEELNEVSGIEENETKSKSDEINQEKSGNDLDSMLQDELLTEFSSDDELLDAFDSQLKALEEESNMLLDNNENLHEDNVEGEEEEVIEKPTDIDVDKFENTDQHPNEPETEEQIKVEDQNTEKEDNLNEDIETPTDEKPVVEASTKKTIKEEKKAYQRAPLRANDLFSFMNNKEIEKIVINVFNEDREDFANTMEKITECFTYEEATDILKAVFFSYRVNPYTRDAVTLTNAVSNYFKQAT